MDELIAFYEPGLRKVNPEFNREWIKQSWLFREPAGQPVVLPNYPDRMPPYETGVPGLILANTTQVYPDDRGTNYAVREAEEVVKVLLGDRRSSGSARRPRRSSTDRAHGSRARNRRSERAGSAPRPSNRSAWSR